MCGRLPAIRNGRVDLSGTAVGSTATYSCDQGFLLVGEATRRCQLNGEWTGNEPFCRCTCLIIRSCTKIITTAQDRLLLQACTLQTQTTAVYPYWHVATGCLYGVVWVTVIPTLFPCIFLSLHLVLISCTMSGWWTPSNACMLLVCSGGMWPAKGHTEWKGGAHRDNSGFQSLLHL